MRHAFRLLPVLAAACLLAMTPAAAQLPEPVARALRGAGMPDTALSALVLRGDQTIISHLADRPMHPASTIKLVTTLVALERLGPTFRGRTELRTTGTQRGDTLDGDLVLRGGADIDLNTEALTTMLRALRYQGIRRIDGRLVVDRSLFEPARPDLGAAPFDEYPDAYYNVVPDALLVNKNMLQLDIRSAGGRPRIELQPELQGVRASSDMQPVDADCASWEAGWKTPDTQPQADGGIKVMLHGTFPKHCTVNYAVGVLDRQAYVDRLVRRIWRDLGGVITGDTLEGTTPPDARLLAEHVSRALPELVRDTNKPSDNVLARTLYLSLGALEPDPVLGSHPQPMMTGPTLLRADQTIRDWLHAHGIDDTGLVLDNGAGLSRVTRIKPVQLGAVLRAAQRSDWAPEFLASLPIAAIDGTMRHRLQASPAAGHARLKTGSLTNIVALAGYVPDAGGRQCIVVAMISSELAGNGRGRAVLDALADWVARQP